MRQRIMFKMFNKINEEIKYMNQLEKFSRKY